MVRTDYHGPFREVLNWAMLLLRSGRVSDPATRFDSTADVLVDGATVAAVGAELPAPDGTMVVDDGGLVVDVSGLVVGPGPCSWARRSVVRDGVLHTDTLAGQPLRGPLSLIGADPQPVAETPFADHDERGRHQPLRERADRSIVTARACEEVSMHHWVEVLDAASKADVTARTEIARLLKAARTTLNMDVAFVTRLDEGLQTFTHIDGDGSSFGWQAGTALPATEGYCQYVLSGELPNIVADSRLNELAAALPTTDAAGIRSYLGVPLVLGSGRIYGALCVSSHHPRTELREADVAFMHFLAQLVADELSQEEVRALTRAMRQDAFTDYLSPGGFSMYGQPIVDLNTGRMKGVEALARFPRHPGNPATVFAAAASAGLGIALELAAIKSALDTVAALPDGVYLSVNASPDAVAGPSLANMLAAVPGDRVVLELTEHVAFSDHAQLLHALYDIKAHGVRVAVDDTGAGYASLQNILALSPEIIKLDLTLVTGIDRDPVRRALARALTGFARECGATLVAEGIETRAELLTLRSIGVPFGQGYVLAPPAPIDSLDFDRRYTD